MAAYAALLSVMHIIEQIQHHPCPPISLDRNQVQSLTEKVTFLQEFLEVYSHVHNEEADRLQSRIADAAYVAEDVIESHIVNKIHAHSTKHVEQMSGSTVDLYGGLQKVIQDMDFIKEDAMEIQEKMGSIQDIGVNRSGSVPISSSLRSPPKGQNIMVGFDDVLIQLMDKLTGHQSSRQIIPIVGMGGIGKTTLAKNAYENPLVVQYFDVRAWIIISQEYSIKEILLEALSCKKYQENKENLSGKSEEELGDMLYKSLFGRRYLIIMDDMWSREAWDKVKFFFPENNDGSRVIITTRLSNISSHLPSASSIDMNFLDEELSWNLLCKIVFGEDGCPLELEEIGKGIAKNCKGLPLSIVVIGGLLAKSEKTREYWKDIAENLNSIVNLEDNERCFKLLYMSYNQLPVHLKPCFLYMGVFHEDAKIRVSDVFKLWVGEGFLKPIIDKSSEEVAEEYLEDLIHRNLILILERKSNEKVKFIKIHDVLRDLCLREAQKEKFLWLRNITQLGNCRQPINAERRIVIHGITSKERGIVHRPQVTDASLFPSLARSLICESHECLSSVQLRLLRVLKSSLYNYRSGPFFWLVNLRCLVADKGILLYSDRETYNDGLERFRSSVYRLWNLQTLIVGDFKIYIEIWRMPLLRHVKIKKAIINPPFDGFDHSDNFSTGSEEQSNVVMENLQTLSNVDKFQCSENMIKMLPNIKKLEVSYKIFKGSRYCLSNLGRLHKLESLRCYFLSTPDRSDLIQNLTFPHSLKKLTLQGCNLHWEDISTKIGSLPFLQVLKLKSNSFIGPEWETVEEQFPSLKHLLIESCDLECWTTDSTHFPCLEHLVLRYLKMLKEIPLCFGEITTLKSIELQDCSNSAVFSAKDIMKEQEEHSNDILQVRILSWGWNDDGLGGLASHNFQVGSPPGFPWTDQRALKLLLRRRQRRFQA